MQNKSVKFPKILRVKSQIRNHKRKIPSKLIAVQEHKIRTKSMNKSLSEIKLIRVSNR